MDQRHGRGTGLLVFSIIRSRVEWKAYEPARDKIRGARAKQENLGTRIGVVGGSGCGKTHLARQLSASLGAPMFSSDDLIATHDWSGASREIADQWLPRPGPWIQEGIALPRALRKWLASHPEGKPLDTLIVLTKPHRPQTPGQATQAKGHDTVLSEILPELRRRGVVIEHR